MKVKKQYKMKNKTITLTKTVTHTLTDYQLSVLKDLYEDILHLATGENQFSSRYNAALYHLEHNLELIKHRDSNVAGDYYEMDEAVKEILEGFKGDVQ